MSNRRRGRNAAVLWGLVVLAAGYGLLLRALPTLTGARIVDGMVGVMLGLYVCSHPAANAIDVLFYSRGPLGRISWSALGWVALNGLVLLVGWLAIVAGAASLVG
ncbi:MAG TPA: hypothetical protein VGM69_13860 [Chloroflexota bacterium]